MTDLYPPGIKPEDITMQTRGCYQVAGRWFVKRTFVKRTPPYWRWYDGFDATVGGERRHTAREAFRDLADWLDKRPASDIMKGWMNI